MYVRISTVQTQPGKIDDLIDGYENYWAGAPQKGLLGGRQLVDRAADRVLNVTIWETLEDMEANHRVNQALVADYASIFLTQPTGEVFEIGAEIEPVGGPSLRRQSQKMYARILTVHIQPGKMDELIDEYQRYGGLLQQKRGFLGSRQLIDRAANKLLSLTLWETLADLEASDSIHKEDAPGYTHIFLAPPTREVFEVGSQIYRARAVEDA